MPIRAEVDGKAVDLRDVYISLVGNAKRVHKIYVEAGEHTARLVWVIDLRATWKVLESWGKTFAEWDAMGLDWAALDALDRTTQQGEEKGEGRNGIVKEDKIYRAIAVG